jgi:hypothetical protein
MSSRPKLVEGGTDAHLANGDHAAMLAAEINTEHAAVTAATQSGLGHAVRAGELLVEVKRGLKHGQWGPWLAANCPKISARTARAYMQVASNRQLVAGFIFHEALKLLANQRTTEVLSSSKSVEWYSPAKIIEPTVKLLGTIDLDPCSNSHENPTVPATVLFTREDDGLKRRWAGRVYMNPPYGSEMAAWVEKLASSYEAGDVSEAIALVPGRIDTEWMRRLRDYPRCHRYGRLRFSAHDQSAPFPSIVFYLGRRIDHFQDAFSDLGDTFERRVR